MKIEKEKIFTSPSDLNNFTLCKYHIKNDKLSLKNKLLKKRKPIGDLELIIELGLKHEKKHLNLFQGQSAKFVFISFASSDPENLPRQKSWFFSRNRLNVAVSRSESIVIIIFNPNLLLTACKKIDEMRLLNNFCKLTKFKTIL